MAVANLVSLVLLLGSLVGGVASGETYFDPEKLEVATDYLVSAAWGSGCMAVMKDGNIEAEEGWDSNGSRDIFYAGLPRQVNSVSKSVVGALIGVAIQRGNITSIDTPASDFIVEWRGSESEDVTVGQLLAMTSGRYIDLVQEYVAPGFEEYNTDYVINELFQAYPPGTRWQYNNNGIQVLDRVISNATGMDTAEFAQEYLFSRLGLTDTYVSRFSDGTPFLAGGVQTTCRDMLTFGTLYLQQGMWEGEQLIPKSFIEESIVPGKEGLNGAYGVAFWMPNNSTGPWVAAEPTEVPSKTQDCVLNTAISGVDDPIMPNIPLGSYVGVGFAGYCLIMDPINDLIVAKFSGEAIFTMLNSCDEAYRVLDIARADSDKPFQSRAEEADCLLDNAAVTAEGCLPERARCNPLSFGTESPFWIPEFLRSPQCCSGNQCLNSWDGNGCFPVPPSPFN